MARKLKEIISIQLARSPGRMVVLGILLFNLWFIIIAASVIRSFGLSGTEGMGFLEAAFYTITMILDAGCVQYVISDIGESGFYVAATCLLIIIIGMVMFTGAVIGYVTNYISSFIQETNDGQRKLTISGHLVILNWNTRASEIVNDLLYCRGVQRVVVISEREKEEIIREVNERISETIRRENQQLRKECRDLPLRKRVRRYLREHLVNNIVLIVRKGEVYSAKQLADISLEQARSVIVLGNDMMNGETRGPGGEEPPGSGEKGNALTVKTLMLLSDITSDSSSADKQKIIVEITDDWTWKLVSRIIQYKQVQDKCNIVPVRVNQTLGQLLAQFSIMPELNLAYKELFSNKGATFYVEERTVEDKEAYIGEFLRTHDCAIPLTAMKADEKDYFYYSAEDDKSIQKERAPRDSGFKVKLNIDYQMRQKNVIILGHNNKSRDIMQGFASFAGEWNPKEGEEILRIVVVDDPLSLYRMDYYQEYPFVEEAVPATIYEQEKIISAVEKFMDSSPGGVSILILSDDSVSPDRVDANALANLVYIQDIIAARSDKVDKSSVDVIVEIINPKHHDIVSSYSVDNVIISNRYISKMITQIGEKDAIFNFYSDILTYDERNSKRYESMEVYTKPVSSFFRETPGECTEDQLVRAVWEASTDKSIPEDKRNPALVLGYVKKGGNVRLFGEDRSQKMVKLDRKDKIIVFTNH